MARPPRFNLPDIPQHAIQRGNNKQVSFFNDKDYVVYLDKLKLYSKKYSVAVHSYVLMANHVRLLMTPETEQRVRQTNRTDNAAYSLSGAGKNRKDPTKAIRRSI